MSALPLLAAGILGLVRSPAQDAATPAWRAAFEALPDLEGTRERSGTEDWLLDQEPPPARLLRSEQPATIHLDNGWIRRSIQLEPGAGTVALDLLVPEQSLLRATRPEARLELDGEEVAVGGLAGQPVPSFLTDEQRRELREWPESLAFQGFEQGPIRERFAFSPHAEWIARPHRWPPTGRELVLHYAGETPGGARLAVDVHHEIYDGLPLLSKWIVVHNRGARAFRIDGFASETLACVEASSEVEVDPRPELPPLHVETDCTLVAMSGRSAQRSTVRWLPDPSFTTQVNYRLQTPCLLECRPPLGPGIALAPGESFESFRTWILAWDSEDAARRSLALGRMYRTIAPWTMENPLVFHQRSSDPERVRAAIDQAAAVGFELVLLTFGSGFDIESEDPAYLASMAELARYAHERGIAFGGYSLLASRSIGPGDDVCNPETGEPGGFATFGSSPCLGSAWGERYFEKLRAFYEATGADVLEHDGSYPGDACASSAHPGHAGYADSYWRQRETITGFYRWCRGRGIYLQVPDWYFLSGSNKTGMGYRETNWSLPRAWQEILERQNVHDGTRAKLPTMGWMFVPLSEYHGGGELATIEPLDQHRDHYERRLQNLLGAGVQACWRGPRLYDTEATRELVARWVGWYKRHRPILDAELLPLRRADGRDWDGWVHVDPALEEHALAVLYNPLEQPIERTLTIPLRYAGLAERATLSIDEGPERTIVLDDQRRARLRVSIPARSMTSLVFRTAP